MPLSAEELFSGGKQSVVDAAKESVGGTEKLQDHAGEVLNELAETASNEGLNWAMKLGLASVILAACYGFVKMNSRGA